MNNKQIEQDKFMMESMDKILMILTEIVKMKLTK